MHCPGGLVLGGAGGRSLLAGLEVLLVVESEGVTGAERWDLAIGDSDLVVVGVKDLLEVWDKDLLGVVARQP